MLKKCGISISPDFAQVDGRVLSAPKVGQNFPISIFASDTFLCDSDKAAAGIAYL